MIMKVLGIDSTATAASVAVVEDGKLLSEAFLNTGLTHSQTLMPLVDSVMSSLSLKCSDIDLFAASLGPGSFTGVRIGVSSIKGMAAPIDAPCFGISTLEAIAYPFVNSSSLICAVMDARCAQVYTACFEAKGGLTRLTEDAAMRLEDLQEELRALNRRVIFAGDGADLTFKAMGCPEWAEVAVANNKYQRASAVALLAEDKILNTDATPVAAALLNPVYLRAPQAERELSKKNSNRV